MVLIGVTVHAAVFLEINKPRPVLLFEAVKGWVTGTEPKLGETHVLRRTAPAGGLSGRRHGRSRQRAGDGPAGVPCGTSLFSVAAISLRRISDEGAQSDALCQPLRR